MGRGGGDQLILGEEDEDDEIRLGGRGGDMAVGEAVGGRAELGMLRAMSPPMLEEEEEEEDAEELLKRLREQNERSWSR